jgi:hypothetical protein
VAIALDVEQGVAQAYHESGYVAAWCGRVRAADNVPVVYTSASSGHLFADEARWLAEWNDLPHLIDGTVATQYTSPVTDPTLTVDLSLVRDDLALWPTSHTGAPMPTAPIVAIVKPPRDSGYWLVDAEGGVFSFGVPFHGSIQSKGIELAAPITTAIASNSGKGYFLVGEDGGVFTFGDAQYKGSIPDHPKDS